MMKKLTIVLLSLLFLCGCVSQYNQDKIDRARTDAKIRKIHHKTELNDTYHKVHMLIAERTSQMQQMLKETNVQLTKDSSLITANYSAADNLISKLRNMISTDNTIIVASFVNIDDLRESSTFGRIISEHYASRFNQKGFTTVEMKLRNDIFIQEGSGEFLLSREVSKISTKHNAQAVVVGTYAVASNKIYITARVIDAPSGRVLCSCDYSVPIGANTFKILLKGKNQADSGWL